MRIVRRIEVRVIWHKFTEFFYCCSAKFCFPARKFLDEFIRIRRGNNEVYDGSYVNVLFMLGNIHKLEGRHGEANQSWVEANRTFKELGLDKENPEIASVMEGLTKGLTRKEDEQLPAQDDVQPKAAPAKSRPRGIFSRIRDSMREEKLPAFPNPSSDEPKPSLDEWGSHSLSSLSDAAPVSSPAQNKNFNRTSTL